MEHFELWDKRTFAYAGASIILSAVAALSVCQAKGDTHLRPSAVSVSETRTDAPMAPVSMAGR